VLTFIVDFDKKPVANYNNICAQFPTGDGVNWYRVVTTSAEARDHSLRQSDLHNYYSDIGGEVDGAIVPGVVMSQLSLVGQKLGKFTIDEELGRGTMGIVYRARDDLDRTVALKVLPPEYTRDQTYIERFKREARSAAALYHRNIVTIFEVGELDNMHYISMRYIEGQTLTDVMQTEGAMPVMRVVELLTPVAAALDVAHVRNIVHRDIKPSNIMVDQDGEIYLTDFGLARGTDPATAATAAGIVLGTPEYMSPEQAQGLSDISQATDIYALGIVAYQMLSGELPFSSETTMMSLFARLKDPPRRLSESRHGISSAVEAAVMKALEREPEKRYTRASELIAALRAAAKSADQAQSNPNPRQTVMLDRERESQSAIPQSPSTIVEDKKDLLQQPAAAVGQSSPRPPSMTTPSKWGVPMGIIIGIIVAMLLLGVAGGALVLMSGSDDPPIVPTDSPGENGAGFGVKGTEESITEPTQEPNEDLQIVPLIENQIVFTSNRDSNSDIFIMNPDGSAQTQLTNSPEDDTAPAIAPDGSRIAFVRDDDIYVINPDGSEVINLTNGVGESNYPTWSPDSSQLAFVLDDMIYLMNADGSEQQPLSGEPGIYRDLDWSPNGALLAFEFNDDIYTMTLTDTVMTNLTEGFDARNQKPAWSPDSSQIAFASDREADTFDIFVMKSDGRDVTQVTVNESIDSAPAWSPDGTRLAFRTARDRNDEIYVINVNGSELTRLTSNDADDTAPVWSP
jgi:serine/threonine protein kinase